ncbi:Uncharacterised protein [Bordetella pertussis]|nr:Uncharacterised protein [Bordetella pertussis]
MSANCCASARSAPRSTPAIRPCSMRTCPLVTTSSTSSPTPHSTRLRMGSQIGP